MVFVAAIVDAVDEQPQAFAQGGDVVLVAGEELPAGGDVEFFHVVLEHFGCVGFRVDADRIEEHISADTLTENLLHLAQARGFQRAGVCAGGEDEIDRHHFVFDHVVEKMHGLAVLVDQGGVGEIVAAPG
ncbi:hypothetical protein D9M71_317820 [compost metagenome]